MLLIDTNVLVYAHDAASGNNKRASEILKSVLRGKLEACTSYQNLIELYAVLTNPQKLRRPYNAREAAELCELYIKSKNLIKLLPSAGAYLDSIKLAGKIRKTSAKIFDCLLAITARENGVETIYTENTKDFEQFEFMKPINPFKME